MRHYIMTAKTRITEFSEGILKFRRHEISGTISSCIGRSKLRNDVSSGNVHCLFQTTCRKGGEMNTSSNLRQASKWNWLVWGKVGWGETPASKCLDYTPYSMAREGAALPRRPSCSDGLLLSSVNEIDFNISIELFGLIVTENGEEIRIKNVS
jgi:hypothetical protein